MNEHQLFYFLSQISPISGEELKVGGSVHGGQAKDLARRRAGRGASLLHFTLSRFLFNQLSSLLPTSPWRASLLSRMHHGKFLLLEQLYKKSHHMMLELHSTLKTSITVGSVAHYYHTVSRSGAKSLSPPQIFRCWGHLVAECQLFCGNKTILTFDILK